MTCPYTRGELLLMASIQQTIENLPALSDEQVLNVFRTVYCSVEQKLQAMSIALKEGRKELAKTLSYMSCTNEKKQNGWVQIAARDFLPDILEFAPSFIWGSGHIIASYIVASKNKESILWLKEKLENKAEYFKNISPGNIAVFCYDYDEILLADWAFRYCSFMKRQGYNTSRKYYEFVAERAKDNKAFKLEAYIREKI